MRRSSLSLSLALAAVAAAGFVAAGALTAPAVRANDVADHDRCIAKGNPAKACDCFVAEVNRRVQAGVKPDTYRSMKAGKASEGGAAEDMSAMGVLIEANVDAAKACGVRLK